MVSIELIGTGPDHPAILRLVREEGFQVAESDTMDASIQGQLQPDMVLLFGANFSAAQLNQYQKHPAARSAEWIVLSDGQPNPSLDALMDQGVAYHFRAPLDLPHLRSVLRDFRQEVQQRRQRHKAAELSSSLDQFGLLMGSSDTMRELYRVLRRVSQTSANVLLLGESGSGKELAARTLHQQSARADQPFIAVNCAALSPELVESELFGHEKGAFTGAVQDHSGVFEQCRGGTLFLDEITEMPLPLQSKLLRVLESGEFCRLGSERRQRADVRVIAASNRPPKQAIEDDCLREDLYFRLAHFPVQLPPLRERGEDVVELAKHFLAYRNNEAGIHKRFSDKALRAIAKYDWPGNVRQLKHCVERAHILADREICLKDLPDLQQYSSPSPERIAPGISLQEAEKNLILATLEHCQQNKTRAAETLGVSVKTLYNKLDRYEQSASR